MRTLLLLAVLAVAVPDRPAPPMPEKPPAPQQLVVGDWQDMSTPSYVLRITPTDTMFVVNGAVSAADGLTAAYTIDWTKSPATIDFMPKQRGGTMPGILKLEGDKLTIALRTNGNNRPLDFKSGDLLLHYQRVKR